MVFLFPPASDAYGPSFSGQVVYLPWRISLSVSMSKGTDTLTLS